MNLTNEQLQAAEKGPVIVEAQGRKYVVLSQEIYERVKRVVEYDDSDEALSSCTVATLIGEAMAEDDANDPLLESYQKYKRKP